MVDEYDVSYQSDAWEAYSTFRAARSLFFCLLLVGLIVVGAVFWLVDTGMLDSTLELTELGAVMVPIGLAAHPGELVQLGGDAASSCLAPERMIMALGEMVRTNLRVWNWVLTFSVVVYCLCLLIGMKLALVGRLGGLADSGKAFFLSLVVMVLVAPWYHIIREDMPGALFSYQQLVGGYFGIQGQTDLAGFVAYYGRFVGLWGLTVILLILAQWHSWQGAKKIRQRLTRGAAQAVAESAVGEQE